MNKTLLRCLGVALLSSSLSFIVHGRSLTPSRPLEHDPMMALPSDAFGPHELRYVTYQQVAASDQPQSQIEGNKQEIVVEYQAQEQRAHPNNIHNQERPEAPYQLIQVNAQQQQQQQQQHTPNGVHVHEIGGPDCHQRHEYTSILSLENPLAGERQQYAVTTGGDKNRRLQGEYSGEIIYLGQNGQELGGIQNAASSLAQSSDLTATILTEIPIKDMPHEVLSKLKREYGVKVVATRERPGANLVINCDDYPNQDSSVCGRPAEQPNASHYGQRQQQPQQPTQTHPQLQPPHHHLEQPNFVYSTAVEPTGHPIELPGPQSAGEPARLYIAHEAPTSPNEFQGLGETALHQPQPAVAAHEASQPGLALPAAEEQANNENANYGTRTGVVVGEHQTNGDTQEAVAPPAAVEPNNQEHSVDSGDQPQSQPEANAETVDQHAGFDEQPKSGEQGQVLPDRNHQASHYERQ